MIKKLQELMMRDIGWKLLSVGIAMVLWFMVINIEHPVDTRTYSQFIQFENEDLLTSQGLTIHGRASLENTKILIKVKAQRTSLDRLGQYKNQIRATVDLQKLEGLSSGETVPVTVNVKLPETAGNGFEIVSKTPGVLDLTLENLVTVERTVSVAVTGGVASGYQLSDPSTTPQNVKISGAQSIVDQIDSVKASLNVEALDTDMVSAAEVYAYDKDGNKIEGISISPKQVKVSLSVRQNKALPVKGETRGIPASGYVVSSVSTNPQSIEVSGAKKDLNRISELTLPEIDVTSQNRDITESFRTQEILPEGLSPVESTPAIIQVNVNIEPESKKRLSYPTSQIIVNHLSEGLTATFAEEQISLDLQGPTGVLNTITQSSVTVTADATGLSAGETKVPLEVEMPEGVTLSGSRPTASIQLSKDASAGENQEATNPPVTPPVVDQESAAEEEENKTQPTPVEPETERDEDKETP